MKKLLLSLIPLLPTLLQAQPNWLIYDEHHRVPFLTDKIFSRDEYHWFILNTGEPSRLFLNGVFVSEESGSNDVGIVDAWAIHYGGGSIAVIDVMSGHAIRIKHIAALVSGAETRIHHVPSLSAANVSAGISNRVTAGYKVIVITTGYGLPYTAISNACRYAESAGAILFCPVPNAGVNIDETPDYPSSWARWITSVVPVTSTDRNGNLYGPNAAGSGEYVTGAPGRNIVIAGSYSSGTSYAAPIVAGCMSLLMQHRPGYTPEAYRDALWVSSDAAIGTRRINAAALMLSLP